MAAMESVQGSGREGAESAASAASESVSKATQSTRQAINEAVEGGRQRWADWGDKASEQAQHWKERGKQGVEMIRGQVERNALISTAIAFGVGFVLARMLFRK